MSLEVLNWGLVDYREAFQRQDELVQKIADGKESEKIIFCSHPPIVTLGRGTREGDVFAWTGDTIEVNRGGRATYHGPSQLIMYPLLYLGEEKPQYIHKKIKPRDLHEYMRILEQSVLLTLQDLGIPAEGHSLQQQVGAVTAEEATGVWVQGKKIAAIGIAVRKWVTSHGVALNLENDPQAFRGFYPCGFRENQVISVEEVLKKKIPPEQVRQLWQQHFMMSLQ